MKLLSLLTLVVVPVTLHAQDSTRTDARHRFTVQVPAGWTMENLDDRGARFQGDGLSLDIVEATGSLDDVVRSLTQSLGSRSGPFREIDRQSAEAQDQRSRWVLMDGVDETGMPIRVRFQAVQGGGVVAAVTLRGERTLFNTRRATIEAIFSTLRLGSNAPYDARQFVGVRPDSTPPAAPTTQTTRATPTPPVSPPATTSPPTTSPPTTSPPAVAAPTVPTAQTATAAPAPPATRSSLGLTLRGLTPADSQAVRLNGAKGLLVEAVTPGGAAAQAGILPGDLLLQLQRTGLDNLEVLNRELPFYHPGELITLLIDRHGTRHRIAMTLGAE